MANFFAHQTSLKIIIVCDLSVRLTIAIVYLKLTCEIHKRRGKQNKSK